MAKRDLQPIIDLLYASGWTDDGRTVEETVRVPTSRAPVFGGIGGEVRTFVGPRVVCFYSKPAGAEATDFVRLPPSHLDAIRTHAKGIGPMDLADEVLAQEKLQAERRPGEPKV